MDSTRIRQSAASGQLDAQLSAKKSDQRLAVFNGQKARLNPYASSVISRQVDAAAGQAAERIEKEMARRRMLEGRRKGEKEPVAAKDLADLYSGKMPGQKTAALLKSLLEGLKTLQNKTPGDILAEVGRRFSDVSDQFQALSYAEEALLAEGDTELAAMVRQAKEQLMEKSGPQVRAGLNIAGEAQKAAEEGLADVDDLRDFYRETILSQEGISNTYRALRKEYGAGKLRDGLDFLLKAATSDMSAEGPSIERGHLKAIMDNFYQVGVVNNIARNLANLLARMQQNFGEGISNDVEGLMDQLFQLVEALRVDFGVIAAIPKKMGARELAWQIYFLTGLHEQLRLLPQKIYPTGDHRTRLLSATQQALDVAIDEEEVENSAKDGE